MLAQLRECGKLLPVPCFWTSNFMCTATAFNKHVKYEPGSRELSARPHLDIHSSSICVIPKRTQMFKSHVLRVLALELLTKTVKKQIKAKRKISSCHTNQKILSLKKKSS